MPARFLLDEQLRGYLWRAVERHNLTGPYPLEEEKGKRRKKGTQLLLFGSLELLEHLLSDERVAGVVEVVAVAGQDAAGLVVRVVLLP